MSVAILAPVLNRPQNVLPLVESIAANTDDYELHFICNPGDTAQRTAVADAGLGYLLCSGGYGEKINMGIQATETPLVFLGADDLRFEPGWLQAATARMGEGFEVVGVNDLIDRPHRPGHATHFLVTRGYCQRGQIDGQPGLLHEGYRHWRIDDELIATATRRGTYAYAPESRVEHLHPMAGKAPDDDTYRRGRAQARGDRRRFLHRERLWA